MGHPETVVDPRRTQAQQTTVGQTATGRTRARRSAASRRLTSVFLLQQTPLLPRARKLLQNHLSARILLVVEPLMNWPKRTLVVSSRV